jgi:hypothetical protein
MHGAVYSSLTIVTGVVYVLLHQRLPVQLLAQLRLVWLDDYWLQQRYLVLQHLVLQHLLPQQPRCSLQQAQYPLVGANPGD